MLALTASFARQGVAFISAPPKCVRRPFWIDKSRKLLATKAQSGGLKKAKQRTKRKAAPVDTSLPPDFYFCYELITELRKDRTAVVDRMGSAALHDLTCGNELVAAYQTLVCLMLSSQTKDTTNAQTMEVLRSHGLTIDRILDTSEDEQDALISKVG